MTAMSAKITGQVWELQIPRMETLILIAMADHADHEGRHVFPSQALISWKTGYSIRQIRRVQESLKQRKILIPEGSGYRGVQHYRLDFSQVPLKLPFVTKDSMSSEDKKSVVKKPHVNTMLHSTTDKMSLVNHSTTDKMSSVTTTDKMSSEDISDTLRSSTTDISDTSHNKDARAESLEALESLDTLQKIAPVETAKAVSDTSDPPPKPKRTPRNEPGQLDPKLITLITAMQVEGFHPLAEETKYNEHFWDTQIECYTKAGVTDFGELLRDVDKYYASHPELIIRGDKSARARMNKALEIAHNKMTSRRKRYG
jgi:hypothetical protein